MVARTRLNVTLYVHYLSCHVIISASSYCNTQRWIAMLCIRELPSVIIILEANTNFFHILLTSFTVTWLCLHLSVFGWEGQ